MTHFFQKSPVAEIRPQGTTVQTLGRDLLHNVEMQHKYCSFSELSGKRGASLVLSLAQIKLSSVLKKKKKYYIFKMLSGPSLVESRAEE